MSFREFHRDWEPPQWPLWAIIIVVLLAGILSIKEAIFG